MSGRSTMVHLMLVAGLAAASACSDASSGGATATTSTSGSGADATTSAPVTAPTVTPADPPATSTPPTTVAAPTTIAGSPQLFDARGPYAVGVLTLDLGDRQSEVYYPADNEAVAGQPTDIFDSVSVFPESFRSFVPQQLQGTIDVGAYRDVAASDAGPFPVIVYSHGFGGYRQAASSYLAHLASWGFVVASTDHVERGIVAVATSTVGPADPDQDLTDLRSTLAALGEENDTPEALLSGRIDLEHLGITGHSAGAGLAVRAADAIDEIDAFISIAGTEGVSVSGDPTGIRFAAVSDLEPGDYEVTIEMVVGDQLLVRFLDEPGLLVPLDAIVIPAGEGSITLTTLDGSTPTPGTIKISYVVPDTPALVMFGENDRVIDPAQSIALYDGLGSPRYLVGIAGAGHNSFMDSCAAIREQGGLESLRLILGPLVDLAQDGCTPGAVDPALVQSVLDHYSTAFFLTYLSGEDQTPTLEVDAVHEFGDIELVAFAAS